MVTASPYANVSDELYMLWDQRPNRKWKLGGFKAEKKGYHSSVNYNLRNYPGHYSIRFPLDLVNYNRDDCRAIDVTMSTSEMIKWTTNMKNSALDPKDNRLDSVREFYGTLDGKTVYGLIKDSETGEWRRSSADETHLWHGHVGIFTAFVRVLERMERILSVWRGESFEDWQELEKMFPKKGDSSEEVLFWQYVHNNVRGLVEPPAPDVAMDGDYGDKTAAAFKYFWTKVGGKGTFDGSRMTAWLGIKYLMALAWREQRVNAKTFLEMNKSEIVKLIPSQPTPSPSVDPEFIRQIVNEWLVANVPSQLTVKGNLEGKVEL